MRYKWLWISIALLIIITPLSRSSIFYAPSTSRVPSINSNLIIFIKNHTLMDNQKLYYKLISSSSWQICNITNNSCTIPLSYLSSQSVYEYYFNSTNETFPGGKFRIALSSLTPDINSSSNTMIKENPEYYGFMGCAPFNKSPDYECELENYQAWTIIAIANAYYMTSNASYLDKLNKMVFSEYDNETQHPDVATCDHADNDFDCETVATFSAITGSLRQGMLIYALWYAYQVTGNGSIRELALNYTEGHADDCDVWNGDYVCNDHDGQGALALGYFKAYEQTGNESYLNIAYRLSQMYVEDNMSSWYGYGNGSKNYTGMLNVTSNGTYVIENNITPGYDKIILNVINVSSAKFSVMINTSNWSVAINWTNETGMLIVNSHNNASALRIMVKNESNKTGWVSFNATIMEDSDFNINNDSYYFALALWKGYEVGGNYSYLSAAGNMTSHALNDCENNDCTNMNRSLSIMTLMNGYEQTGNSGYLSRAYSKLNEMNGSCSPLHGNYTCGYADYHYSLSRDMFMLYQMLPYTEKKFYGFRIKSVPRIGNDLIVHTDMNGVFSNPQLRYRQMNDTWHVCGIDISTGDCIIQKNLLRQGVYEMYFIDNALSFPYGKFRLALSNSNETIKNASRKIINSDPETETPTCGAWKNDYMCEYETRQAWMILGFSNAYLMTHNETYLKKLINFSLSEYDETLGAFATCDHADNDFDCNTSSGISGSLRQGMLIYALWYAYQVTGNGSIRELALNYTEGHADDCDVWNGDYVCNDHDGQGALALGYFKAYEQTGDDSYLSKARALTSYKYNDSYYFALALWKGYEILGNETYRMRAENMSSGFINTCLNDNCTLINKSLNIINMIESYEQTGNATYIENARLKYADLNYSCNPWNDDYNCSNPEEQGMLSYMLWLAYRVMNATIPLRVNAHTPTSAYVNDLFNATCAVENTGDINISGITVHLNISDDVENLTTLDYNIDNLNEHSSINMTFSLKALSQGQKKMECIVYSPFGTLTDDAHINIISHESQQSTSSTQPSQSSTFSISPLAGKAHESIKRVGVIETSFPHIFFINNSYNTSILIKNSGNVKLSSLSIRYNSTCRGCIISFIPSLFSLEVNQTQMIDVSIDTRKAVPGIYRISIEFIFNSSVVGSITRYFRVLFCQPRSRLCENDTLMICNGDGMNYTIKKCSYGCDNILKACVEKEMICIPDSTWCTNGTLFSCSNDGLSISKRYCIYGCNENGTACMIKRVRGTKFDFILLVIFIISGISLAYAGYLKLFVPKKEMEYVITRLDKKMKKRLIKFILRSQHDHLYNFYISTRKFYDRIIKESGHEAEIMIEDVENALKASLIIESVKKARSAGMKHRERELINTAKRYIEKVVDGEIKSALLRKLNDQK